MDNLRNFSLTKVSEDGASAGTAVNSSSVDMQDWTSVIFFGTLDTADAGNSAVLATSADDTTFTDVTGLSVTTGDNDDVFLLGLTRPDARYVRCELDRSGANTAHGEIYAIRFGPARKLPGTHGTNVDSDYAAT